MAMVQHPDGTVEIVDDATGLPMASGVPPAALGSLYNPAAVAPPPAPDMRTAQAPPQPTGAPPQIRDWVMGGGAQQPQGMTPGQTAVQRRLAGPDAPPSAATPSAPTPQRAVASGLPESGRVQDDVSDFVRQQALKSMMPRAGVRVDKPARDVLKGFNVDVAPKLSEETKLEREIAGVRQQSAAAESGMLRSAAAEDAGMVYEQRRQDAQSEIARIRDEERERDQLVGARMREIDMMGEELRSKRKGATNPDAYWEDKGVLGTILAKIGMALYAGGSGIGGYDPLGLTKEINAQAARYNDAKRVEVELLGNEINEKRTQLGEVRKRFLSRDAAEHATRALMSEAMAAETASMAEHYKSADAQATAKQLMAGLQAQSAEARAAAELAEKDAVTQAWQHMEAQRGVVGGSVGGIEGAKRLAKQLGIPVMDVLRAAGGQGLPLTEEQLKVAQLNKPTGRGAAELQKHKESGIVQLPDGRYAYTPHGGEAAHKTQDLLHSMPALAANLREMRGIVKGVASVEKLSPEARERLRVLASENAVHFKKAPKEALTIGELDALWSGMIGNDINKIWRYGNEEAQLEQAARSAENIARTEMGGLREVPPDVDPGRPFQPPTRSEPEKR